MSATFSRAVAGLAVSALLLGAVACSGDQVNSCRNTTNCGNRNDVEKYDDETGPPVQETSEDDASGSGTDRSGGQGGTRAEESPFWGGEETADTTHPPGRMWLADLPPVAHPGSDTDIGEIAMVDGNEYRHSVLFSCSAFCNDNKSEISFDLNRRFATFSVGAGVLQASEDSSEVGSFQVFLDDEAQDPLDVPFGKVEQRHYDVRDVVRLRLVAYRTDTVGSPLEAGVNAAGGVSNALPHLGWLNPELNG
ncbi:hypothetical protein ABZ517_03215 [Streptomyces scabiei]|uniref:hypothetical protein n=1 Tax=Streptomyces TaxID=1883 RepID=UPI0029AF4C1C|nr:hypothetical protein [Streptomyces sp. ND04-05B]MDX3070508.1 hypothetical protein [Streptomyces sp. ND04-05B]